MGERHLVNIVVVDHVHVSKRAEETIRWQIRPPSRFAITAIEANPFKRELPFRSNGENFIDSGPLKPDAAQGVHKVTIEIYTDHGTDIYDPHIDVGP